MKLLKKIFCLPSAEQLALRELEDAKRELLQSQTAADYAINVSNYHQERITRLTQYLKDAHDKTQQLR